jgi:hypothetical protein
MGAARGTLEDRQILNFFEARELGELTPIKDAEDRLQAGGYNKASEHRPAACAQTSMLPVF